MKPRQENTPSEKKRLPSLWDTRYGKALDDEDTREIAKSLDAFTQLLIGWEINEGQC